MQTAHTVCFCNNRGGVGKTFLTFQTSCEAARSQPLKKILVVDFSIYSHLSAMLLGGTATTSALAAPIGLVTCREVTTPDTRVEGLIRKLDSRARAARKNSASSFLRFLRRSPPPPVDLSTFMIQASLVNDNVPPNLFVIASAGSQSWERLKEDENPLWERKGDEWFEAALVLREAIEALPEDFEAVFFDTDHLAASAFTKIALCACDSLVVPCSTDTADFQRLYETADSTQFNGVESLFTDVMLSMFYKNQLRASVECMVFAQVASLKNESSSTPGGIELPFKPTKTMMANLDCLANMVFETCVQYPQYRPLFRIGDQTPSLKDFTRRLFSASKLVPDLAKNVSTLNGVPLCCMTSETYTAVNGLKGSSSPESLDAVKSETQQLVARLLHK
jgi:cellulose biosynthesis protein BcsQ